MQARLRAARLTAAGLTVDPALAQPMPTTRALTTAFVATLMQAGATGIWSRQIPWRRGCVRVLDDMGLRPPHDLSFAILGQPIDGALPYPDTTMFSIPRRLMGATAVQLLAERLQQPQDASVQRKTLPCTFIAGSTVASPPPGG